ncbi:MAG TPA: imidazolonepropionase [Planctomycetota bacterium]|jgi:imidazolonepropionase|nr:imidazolonepropionase [Planctomycetota bacterium]
MAETVDLLVHGAAELLTLGEAPIPRRKGALRELGSIARGALAADRGKVLAVGTTEEIRDRFRGRVEVDASGKTVLPAFVDPHAHPCFAGDRAEEFESRCAGATYEEIAAGGGGILRTVTATRRASREELIRLTRERLDRFLSLGTTLLEAKSGYGLSTAVEIRSLEAIASAAADHPVEVSPTFLGAQAIPAEFRSDRKAYLRLLVEEALPEIARRRLAEACDVFLEKGAFEGGEAREILEEAKRRGLRLRVHADQLSPGGGAELACELGADSADHLDFVSERGIEALAASETVAVLLPGVPFFLRKDRDAPARRLIDAGAAVALATDFNPGSCFCASMAEVLTLARLRLGMSAAEGIAASTANAAFALRRTDRGRLVPGCRADLIVCDVPGPLALGYEFGRSPVETVVAGGRIVRRVAGS